MAAPSPEWKSVDDEMPEPGEKVLVCNATSEWTTPWKDGLVHAEGMIHPVTHFMRTSEIRPYPAQPRQTLEEQWAKCAAKRKEERRAAGIPARNRSVRRVI